MCVPWEQRRCLNPRFSVWVSLLRIPTREPTHVFFATWTTPCRETTNLRPISHLLASHASPHGVLLNLRGFQLCPHVKVKGLEVVIRLAERGFPCGSTSLRRCRVSSFGGLSFGNQWNFHSLCPSNSVHQTHCESFQVQPDSEEPHESESIQHMSRLLRNQTPTTESIQCHQKHKNDMSSRGSP